MEFSLDEERPMWIIHKRPQNVDRDANVDIHRKIVEHYAKRVRSSEKRNSNLHDEPCSGRPTLSLTPR
jgi:hypothetical protein